MPAPTAGKWPCMVCPTGALFPKGEHVEEKHEDPSQLVRPAAGPSGAARGAAMSSPSVSTTGEASTAKAASGHRLRLAGWLPGCHMSFPLISMQ